MTNCLLIPFIFSSASRQSLATQSSRIALIRESRHCSLSILSDILRAATKAFSKSFLETSSVYVPLAPFDIPDPEQLILQDDSNFLFLLFSQRVLGWDISTPMSFLFLTCKKVFIQMHSLNTLRYSVPMLLL